MDEHQRQQWSNVVDQWKKFQSGFRIPLTPNLISVATGWRSHLQSAITDGLSRFPIYSNRDCSSIWNPSFSCISMRDAVPASGVRKRRNRPMKLLEIEKRLAGTQVYALNSSDAEYCVSVSGPKTGMSLGLLFFREEDAYAMLEQLKLMNGGMLEKVKVVKQPLSKAFQEKVDGVALRFLPETKQVMNALEIKKSLEDVDEDFSGGPVFQIEKSLEDVDEDFPGVPVFQSKSLGVKIKGQKYQPVFFRKEDLDRSLHRISYEQRMLNPALRYGDVEVHAMEDILKEMQMDTDSKWENVYFVPPGFDISSVYDNAMRASSAGKSRRFLQDR